MGDANNADMAVDGHPADEEMIQDVQVQMEALPLEMEAINLNATAVRNDHHQEATLRNNDGSGDNANSNNIEDPTVDSAMAVDSAGDSSPAVQPRRLRCAVLKQVLVFQSDWSANADRCTICRNYIAARCLDCETANRSQTDCVAAQGVCDHVFHHHCIARWVQVNNVCPLDNTRWHYRRDINH